MLGARGRVRGCQGQVKQNDSKGQRRQATAPRLVGEKAAFRRVSAASGPVGAALLRLPRKRDPFAGAEREPRSRSETGGARALLVLQLNV